MLARECRPGNDRTAPFAAGGVLHGLGGLPGLVTVAVVLVGASAFGLWRRRTDGGLAAAEHAPDRAIVCLTPAEIGVQLGDRATLVQFSSAFCQPCVATRRTLADVAAMVDGVIHVDLDAESHLQLVRRLGVLRTPTVFVLDRYGAVVRRATGQPRRADVIAALGEVG
jgi:thiol-disulfide isomerase/thioredoxin